MSAPALAPRPGETWIDRARNHGQTHRRVRITHCTAQGEDGPRKVFYEYPDLPGDIGGWSIALHLFPQYFRPLSPIELLAELGR